MKNKTLLILFSCLIISLVLFPIISASIINLDKPLENYTTIQEAINNASNGERIFVSSGIYNEKVIINKSISLLGEQKDIDGKKRDSWSNESVLISSNPEGTIQIIAKDVVINGIKIKDSEIGINSLMNSSNITLSYNVIENTKYGIAGYYKNSLIKEKLVNDYSCSGGVGIGGQLISVNIKKK